MATRRAVLTQIALGLGVVASRGALGQPAEGAVYLGAETSAETGLSRASFFGPSGARLASVPLDFRAHGMAADGRRIVVFPRRPGTRFAVVDRDLLEILAVVTAPHNRHFYGHGAFSRDGKTLLVTENDLDTLQGRLGIYEVAPKVRRIGEIAFAEAGPHEIARHPDRDVFFVALGGIETHPDYGRMPLNLNDFRSQVVALDFETGSHDPLGYWAGSEGVSLRHLAMDGQSRLYVGGQREDPGRASGTSVLWLVDGGRVAPVAAADALGGYVSSVAAHGSGAAAASKETGQALQFDGNRIVGSAAIDGASAVARGPGLDAVSGYTLLRLNGADTDVLPAHEFDNHGLSLRA